MNANNVPIINLKKESLINAFQNYMGRSFSNDKMLRFLSAYNATKKTGRASHFGRNQRG